MKLYFLMAKWMILERSISCAHSLISGRWVLIINDKDTITDGGCKSYKWVDDWILLREENTCLFGHCPLHYASIPIKRGQLEI